jgi:hypothetical protein
MNTSSSLLASPLLVVVLLSACDREPSLLRQARKTEAVGELGRAFLRSVEAEKSAVLATSDEASERFAGESRQAAAEVERLTHVLEALVAQEGRGAEAERLRAFSSAWRAVAAIDAQLLPLAVANTNLKAAHLSTHAGAAALERLTDVLQALEASARDPARLRALSRAAVAALTIQTLHAPHIAAAADAEMTALEGRIVALEMVVDGTLAVEPSADGARAAWAEYRAATAEVLRLSRENTNVRSFALSVHEKRDASLACEAALQALVTEVQAPGPQPTR